MLNRRIVLPLALLFLLTACGSAQPGGEEGKSIAVYYAALQPYDDGVSVASEMRTLSDAGEPIEELMALLLDKPVSGRLISPIPSGVTLNEWSLREGVLHVELSEAYGGLSGIDLTIADYCIALTLCQLDEVRSVIVSVDGDLLPSRYYQALRSSDVLLSGMEDDPVFIAVELWFPNADKTGLITEQRDVLIGGGITRSAAVVNALIEGPGTEDLNPLMPEGTRLRSTSVEHGVCYVDLSAAFGQAPFATEKEGALLLYAIVNTLGKLSGVEEVQILIEGKAPAFFGGVPTLKPLEPDFSLLIK